MMGVQHHQRSPATLCLCPNTVSHLFHRNCSGSATEGIYLRAKSDENLFILSRLRTKTKMQLRLLRDVLFVDDAALRTHSRWPAAAVEQLFAKAFGNQPAGDPGNGTKCWQPPSVCITDYELGALHEFACLVSTISNTRSLNTELNKRIGKAASTLSRLLLYGTGFREEANGKTPAGL